MDLTSIRVAIDDGMAALTLSRPDAGNSIDLTMARELSHVTAELALDRDVRAVLLCGEGRSFCVGGDLKEFAARRDLPAHLVEVTDHLHAAMSRLMRLDAPVVAAVQGSAAGAGLSLATAADIVLAGASSRFVMAYTAIGLTPDGSGTWSLPRLIGLRRALDLTLTNRPLSAEEAVDAGLATRVVADDDLLSVSTARGAITLPVVVTPMHDGVVWVPTNSVGSAVRATLGVDAGAVVRISRASTVASTDHSETPRGEV